MTKNLFSTQTTGFYDPFLKDYVLRTVALTLRMTTGVSADRRLPHDAYALFRPGVHPSASHCSVPHPILGRKSIDRTPPL